MTLSSDVSRCAGRFGLGPDDPVCPRRESCVRYLQMANDRERWPEGYPVQVPVMTGLCRDGGDYMIEDVRWELTDKGREMLKGPQE